MIIKMVGYENRKQVYKDNIFEFLNHIAYLKDIEILNTDIK